MHTFRVCSSATANRNDIMSEVYEGQDFVCKKHGHKLIVIYEDGYNLLVADRDRLVKELEKERQWSVDEFDGQKAF